MMQYMMQILYDIIPNIYLAETKMSDLSALR